MPATGLDTAASHPRRPVPGTGSGLPSLGTGPAGAQDRPCSPPLPRDWLASLNRHCPGAVRPVPVRRVGSSTTTSTGTAMSTNRATAAGGGGAGPTGRNGGSGARGAARAGAPGAGAGRSRRGGTTGPGCHWAGGGTPGGRGPRGASTGVGRPRDIPERQGVRTRRGERWHPWGWRRWGGMCYRLHLRVWGAGRHLRGWRRDREPPLRVLGERGVEGRERRPWQACACSTSRSPWGRLSLPFPQGTPKISSSQQLTRLCFCDAWSSAESFNVRAVQQGSGVNGGHPVVISPFPGFPCLASPR